MILVVLITVIDSRQFGGVLIVEVFSFLGAPIREVPLYAAVNDFEINFVNYETKSLI